MRVLADGQMGENADRLTDRRQLVVTRKRNENFVTDAVHIDDRLRRQRALQFAVEKGDHLKIVTTLNR